VNLGGFIIRMYQDARSQERQIRPKSLIAVFSVRVDRENLMPCTHFTLFFFMFILKLQELKLKH